MPRSASVFDVDSDFCSGFDSEVDCDSDVDSDLVAAACLLGGRS